MCIRDRLRPVLGRCPVHEKVKLCAGDLNSRNSKWLPNHELSAEMATFCTQFIMLQKDRHKADYSLIDVFSQQDARQAWVFAKSIVEDLIPRLQGTYEYDAFVLGCIGIKPTYRD